jgi:ribosomal protein L11 methyltransferase
MSEAVWGGATWLEVSLTVDGELAESVAEVLARFIPDGVVIETTGIAPDVEGEGVPVGPLRVCGYIPVDGRLEETRRKIEEALWYLGRIPVRSPLPAAQFRPIQEENWNEAWKQHYHPIAIGRRLIILPAWLEAAGQERIPIHIDPGMAFGTGTHPTTQLCLEIIESLLVGSNDYHQALLPPGVEVIDIGCGSGILSITALKLGAHHALGVDVDSQAIPNARVNAFQNGVTERLELGVGSIAEILAGAFSIRRAPLVLANILAPVIVRLLDSGMADLLTPGGVLVLSGILEEQWLGVDGHVSLKDALERHDLQILEQRQSGDWIALAVTHA